MILLAGCAGCAGCACKVEGFATVVVVVVVGFGVGEC